MLRSRVKDNKSASGLAPVVASTTKLSSACDTQYFESATAVLHVGVFGDTQSSTVYIEAELQDSDDNSSYAAVADALLAFAGTGAVRTGHATGTFFQSKTDAAADLAGLYEVAYLGSKRYLKVNVRLTGTQTNGTPIEVNFKLADRVIKPAQ